MPSLSSPAVQPTRLHQLIDPWAASQPDAPAVSDAHVALSYAQLKAATVAAAEKLQALGVRGGDRVLIVGENCAAIGVFVLALSRLDAWASVVNARLSEREVDGFIAHSGARRVLYTCHVSPDAERHAQRHGARPADWPGLGVVPIGPLAGNVEAEACRAACARPARSGVWRRCSWPSACSRRWPRSPGWPWAPISRTGRTWRGMCCRRRRSTPPCCWPAWACWCS